jgi:hypothetical protein
MGAGFEMEARFVAVVPSGVLVVDETGFAGGAIELLDAEAAEGRVVVRALDVVEGVPPIDGRGRIGLVMLLFEAESEVRGFAPSVEDVDAVLIRLFKPLAPALLAAVVVGRVGGLLRVLLVAVPGEAVLLVELAEARVALVVVGFLIGGAEVREPGFAFSIALMRDATVDIFDDFGDGFSVPDESASRSDIGASEPDSTSAAAGGASGASVSAMSSCTLRFGSDRYRD